jgi:stearoyl-CoA desaturase (delta-9 desaturase)
MNHIPNSERHINFSLNIICYIALITSLIIGSWTDYFIVLAVYFFIGMNEQAFFHRMLTHKSWDCPRWLKVIGTHISTLSLLSPVIVWVACHRQHHRYTDTPTDPHSPLYKSRFDIQFKSSYYNVKFYYAADLIRDKLYQFYTEHYFKVIFLSWLAIALIAGPYFLLLWLAGTSLVILSANGINAWHHGKKIWAGQYQLHQVSDTAKNDLILGYLHFDGWHNNHHASANKYYYGERWWEIDICGLYVWFLATITGYNRSLVK